MLSALLGDIKTGLVTTEYRLLKVEMIEFGVIGDEGRTDLGSRKELLREDFVSPSPSMRFLWEGTEFVRNEFMPSNASVSFFWEAIEFVRDDFKSPSASVRFFWEGSGI